MSDYPKTYTIAYAGRRNAADGSLLYAYAVLNADLSHSGRDLNFSKRIKCCYGIGTIAEIAETKENTFNLAGKYVGSFVSGDATTAQSEMAARWRTEDEATMGARELRRKEKGEDAWFVPLSGIKDAYQNSNRGQKAVIIAKLIQYLDTR